jgi:hypothetical protein
MATDNIVYLRNARPNQVIFHYDGLRYKLEHRGNRNDTVALPAGALNDRDISRWVQVKQLEVISKDSFVKLATRTVDILPNEFLQQPIRRGKGVEVPMVRAEGDISGTKTQIVEADAMKTVKNTITPKWGGDLMSTEEELDSGDFQNAQTEPNYPSRHREGDTREAGY